MRRPRYLFILLLTIFCTALLIAPTRSRAITYGFIDSNNTFSNTGAFIVKSPSTGQIFPICSGTLITPNVFLTAAHCTSFFTSELAPRGFTAYASFDGSIPFGSLTTNQTTLIAASFVVSNPNFSQRGDSVCRATNVDYRLDTSSAQAFFAYVNATFGTQIPIVC